MSDHSADLAAVKPRSALVLCAALALAGCGAPTGPAPAPGAGQGGAVPRTAILYRDTVTVQYSDGALCVAPRPGSARAWSGRLAGCPHLAPFRVTLPDGPLAPRRVLVRLEDGGTAVIVLERARFGLSPGV